MATTNSAISRRDFLVGLGKTAAISSGLFVSGCASSMIQTGGSATGPLAQRGPARAVDIHHHYFPPELMEEIKKHGKALGVEHLPPKDSQQSPFSFSFARRRRLSLEPALAELDKRLEAMGKGREAQQKLSAP